MSRPLHPHEVTRRAEHLRGRVLQVADRLGIDVPDGASPAATIQSVAIAVARLDDTPSAWLLYTALAGAMPGADALTAFQTALGDGSDGGIIVHVLEAVLEDAIAAEENVRREIDIVEDAVVVDVDFCARYEHNTGVQRVVRETMPRWVENIPDVRLHAWTDDLTGFRDLEEIERDRVLHWSNRRFAPSFEAHERATERIVVPWRSTIVLPEVPQPYLVDRIRVLAESSGNSVVLIGYDAIPVVSAFATDAAESERFANYLAIVKHCDLVAAISESSAEEFRGFVDALQAQGLDGPRVETVSLPLEAPKGALEAHSQPVPPAGAAPLVLCVGSHEPRKNQEAVLHAAERLFAEGVDFELAFVGRGTRRNTLHFDRRVQRLAKQGHKVAVYRDASDRELWILFSRARFSAFLSMHEGYGLPVAESIAFGVPVLTSNFGSLAEIASAGGAVTVDPRDDDAIVSAMRLLLTDEAYYERVTSSIVSGGARSWDDYALDLAVAMGFGR
jgi:glycosyltransferase involved in cell wall biosynthesis